MQTVMVEQHEPYVGPRPFKTKEKELFFGRKREIEELVSLITAHPIVLFYAQSGAGKTSLLNAGLIPKLTDEEEFDVLKPMRVQGQLPPTFKIDKRKNIYMLNALMSSAEGNANPSKLSSLTLADFLKERPKRNNKYGEPTLRVIIFDQFEELFTAYPRRWEDRQAFFEQVRDALEGNPKEKIEGDPLLRVVFSMREDYIAELDPYAQILPEYLRTRFRLEQMKEKSTLEAVVEPLKRKNASFAPGVAKELVKNLLKVPGKNGDSPKYGQYVEPVQLQIVCQSLWESLKDGETVITQTHLEDYGDLSQVLSDFYEKGVREVAKETAQNESDLRQRESDLRSWIENTFITSDGTRAPITRGDEVTSGQPSSIVDLLAEKKLLKEEWRGTGTRWYELAHDRFIEPIRKSNEKWLNEQNRTEQMRLRLEAKAKRWRQGVGELLEGDELFEARRLVGSPAIKTSKDLKDLVNASKATAQQKRFRMYKRGVAALALLLLFMSGLAVYAFIKGNEATEQSNLAKINLQKALQEKEKAVQFYLKEQTLKEALEKKTEEAKIERDAAEKLRGEAQGEALKAEQGKQEVTKALVEAQHARDFAQTQRKLAEDNAKLLEVQKGVIEGYAKNVEGYAQNLRSIANQAHSRLLAITAGAYLDDDPELSVLLAQRASNEFGRTFAGEGVIRAGMASLSSGSHVLRKHEGRINFVELSSDGTRVVTASDDKTAQLWNWTTGKSTELLGHKGAVLRASFSPDGKLIVSASLDGTARIWDGNTGEFIRELKGHTGAVTRAVWSPDSKYIATGSEDTTAKIWDARTGEVIETLKGHSKAVHDLAWSQDGTHIATEGFDGTGRIWKLKRDKPVLSGEPLVLNGLTGAASAIAFSPNSKWLITESGPGRATIWKVETGKSFAVIGGNQPDSPDQDVRSTITSVDFSPDNRLVVVADSSGIARVWSIVEDGVRLVSELRGHTLSINSAEFSTPDGNLVVTASADNTARVWNAATGQSLRLLSGHSGRVQSADFSPNNRDIIVTGSDDGTARVWDTTCVQPLLPELRGQTAAVSSAIFNPKFDSKVDPTVSPSTKANTYVITTSYDGTIRVWDAHTGRSRPYRAHYDRITYAAFSRDARNLISTSYDKTAQVWSVDDKNNLTQKFRLIGHTDRVVKAAFSPDAKFILTASVDGTARVWSAETGQFVKMLEEHKDGTRVNSVDYSPDGESIITASSDKTVRIWNARDFSLKKELPTGHEKSVSSARYSSAGDLIVTASQDGTARVWDSATYAMVIELKGHTGEVNSAIFSPDGQFIVTASDDKTARVWDTKSWKTVNVLRGQKNKVFTATFSPDSQYIMTGSEDGTARIYPPEMFAMPINELLDLIPRRILQRTLAEEEWKKYKDETLAEQ